jgi:mutator protein MutT
LSGLDTREAEPVTVVAARAESMGADGGRTLFLARRAAGARHGGLWELPGGKVEPGEEAGAALLRELREELGISATLLGLPERYDSQLEGRRFVFLVFPVEFEEEPSILTAHDAWAFVAPSELDSYSLAPLDGPALAAWASRTGDQGREDT